MAGWFYPQPPPIPTLVPLPAGAAAFGNALPTPIGPGATTAALRAMWPPEDWPAQRGASIAGQLATAQLNPASPTYPLPFYNSANASILRASWPAENWATQVLIGGGVGALTATAFIPPAALYTTNPALQSLLRGTWWLPESWPAQTGARIASLFATVVNPPVIYPAPPTSARIAIRQSWPEEYWYPQSECGIASGLAQLQQPPLYLPSSTVAQGALINSTWPRDDWRAQWAGATAGGWYQVPVTATPSPPKHIEISLWTPETWPVQRSATIASLFATTPQAQPYISIAQLMNLLSTWPQEQWSAQRAAVIASLLAVPPAGVPYANLPLQSLLRGLWLPERWPIQSAAPTAGIIAPAVPPPPSFVLVSTAVYAIVNAGLEVFIQYATSPIVPAGFVISQSPAALTGVPTWTVVTITVSGGPAAPAGFTSVPTLIGLFARDATNALQAAMLSLDRYLWQVSSAPEGTVVNQSVAANLIVPVSTIVQLTLSAGPAKVPPTTTVPLVH